MIPARPLRRPDLEPLALHDRAMDNLRFIRETMERSASFTAVSGWAGCAMGSVALAAAWIARSQVAPERWMTTWLGAAAMSLVMALVGMTLKSRAAGLPLLSGPGRKFAHSFSPPIVVGGILTVAMYVHGQAALLPGMWLLLYGTAVVTGGSHSVRIIPLTGIAFILIGTAALLASPSLGDAFMAAGFGGLHLVSGFLIARRHGG